MSTESVIKEIINGKKNILSPIFDGLAYLDVEITDKDNCLINLGNNYYLKTKMTKAIEITKRINLEKAKNERSIRKLDDNTFEIRENIASHEEEEKEKDKTIDNKNDKKNDEKEKFRKIIEEENKKLLEKIDQLNKEMQSQSCIKRLKLKKKEEIVDIVLKKLNSN